MEMPHPDNYPPMDPAVYQTAPWFEPANVVHDEDDFHPYEHGCEAFKDGKPRSIGCTMYSGTMLAEFECGWDDAEEDAADVTEAELVLPMVAEGGAA
jgi:hypothetical protein